MGNDSSAPSAHKKDKADVPYTNFSVSAKVTANTSPQHKRKRIKDSGRLRSSTLPDVLANDSEQRCGSPEVKSKHDTLIVVHEGTTSALNAEDEELLKRLNHLPYFSAVLGNYSQGSPIDPSRGLDSTSFVKLCSVLNKQAKHAASYVAQDQNELSSRIAEVDVHVRSLMSAIRDRYAQIDKQHTQLKRVTELNSQLSRIRINIAHVESLTVELNELLPPELRVPPPIREGTATEAY